MDIDLRLFLAKPDKTEIGEIVDLEGAKHNLQTSTSDEFTITIPYLIKRERSNKFLSDVEADTDSENIEDVVYVENPIFHQVREKYLVRVQSNRVDYDKWMVVSNIRKVGNDSNKTKEIRLYSKEYELSYQPIIEWAGVLVNGEYRKESLTIQQVTSSLLSNEVWSLGTVDAQIDDYRSFDFSGITKLEAIYDIAKKFKAVTVWDTFNNTVNFVHEDNYSSDEGLHISYEKYLDSIDEEIDASDIVTKIIPKGYDGITINEYNPTGTNYVQNFDFFMYPFSQDSNGNVVQSSYWLSDGLCQNLVAYKDLVESKTSEYNTLVTDRDALIQDRLDKEGQISDKQTEIDNKENEIDLLQSQDMDASTAQSELDVLESEMSALQSELTSIENSIDTKTQSIQTIANELSMDNNFTQSQLRELSTIGKTEEWSNESIDDREELYDESLEELEKRNKPQPVIKASLVDLYHIQEAFHDLKKVELGAKVLIEYEFFNINIEAQIIEFSIDYLQGSVDLTISSIEQLKDDEDKFIDTVYSNASVAGQVLSNKSKWDKVTDVNNTVAEFLNNKLDSAKQEIVSGANETVTINNRGITLTDTNDPMRFIRQTNSVIGFTADGGYTFSTAISPDGVFADKLIGQIIAGQNLTIENSSGTYLMNDDGFTIEGGSLKITNGLPESEIEDSATVKWNNAESNAKQYTDNQLSNYVTAVAYNDDLTDLQNQIDGSITNFFEEGEPTLSNYPANSWTTDELKSNHLGDIYYDELTGYSYRFQQKSDGTFNWKMIQDTDIQKAIQDASQAQATADGKMKVFSSTPTVPYQEGDLWKNGQTVYVSTVNKSEGSSFSSSDWQLAGDVTIQNTSNNTENVGDTNAQEVANKANSSIQEGELYNGVTIDATDGVMVNRSDSLVKSYLNATEGFKIQGRSSTSGTWEDRLYADTNGDLIVQDVTANNLTVNGGSIEWSNVSAPDYSQLQGSKPPSNADVTETELTSTSVYAPYLEVNSANIQGTLTAQELKTKDGSTLLSEVSSNANGGVMHLNDSSGSRNVKIGVEGLEGTNTGGTMILYDDSINSPRVEAGIANGNGRINTRDSGGTVRAFIEADTPSLSITNTSGTSVTYLTEYDGYINQEKIATQNWVQNNADLTAKFG